MPDEFFPFHGGIVSGGIQKNPIHFSVFEKKSKKDYGGV
jgi:hypothetical protein